MDKLTVVCLVCWLAAGCSNAKRLEKHAHHYQAHNDFRSLEKVVKSMKPGMDTAFVKKLLGEPIDMGFDYRYLVDSTGPTGCAIGAVFHIGEQGKIDQQWIGEICE